MWIYYSYNILTSDKNDELEAVIEEEKKTNSEILEKKDILEDQLQDMV